MDLRAGYEKIVLIFMFSLLEDESQSLIYIIATLDLGSVMS
jgi:hypothetical protein